MNNSKEETSVAQYIIQRMSLASVDVTHRHQGNAVIASVGEALVPVAQAYSASYQELETAHAQQSASVEASREATEELGRTMTAWLGPLARDLPGVDPSAFGRRPEVTLDMVSDGHRLIEVVQVQGTNLGYKERALTALQGAVGAAEAAHTQAQNARIDLQDKQAETRRLAGELQPHLIALRRVLRAELGRSHHDYQRLRVVRGRPEVEEGQAGQATGASEISEPGEVHETFPANGGTRAAE
jgi:hypothetical protein